MYLTPDEARGLISTCAGSFPGNGMVFDVVPRWLAERSQSGQLKTKAGYEPPPWSWGVDREEEQRLRSLPRVAELRALRLPRGRGLVHGAVLPAAARIPALHRLMLSVLSARFA